MWHVIIDIVVAWLSYSQSFSYAEVGMKVQRNVMLKAFGSSHVQKPQYNKDKEPIFIAEEAKHEFMDSVCELIERQSSTSCFSIPNNDQQYSQPQKI